MSILQDTIEKVKKKKKEKEKKATNWENIFVTLLSDKGLVYRIWKELLNEKSQITQKKNEQEIWIGISQKQPYTYGK